MRKDERVLVNVSSFVEGSNIIRHSTVFYQKRVSLTNNPTIKNLCTCYMYKNVCLGAAATVQSTTSMSEGTCIP